MTQAVRKRHGTGSPSTGLGSRGRGDPTQLGLGLGRLAFRAPVSKKSRAAPRIKADSGVWWRGCRQGATCQGEKFEQSSDYMQVAETSRPGWFSTGAKPPTGELDIGFIGYKFNWILEGWEIPAASVP